MPFDRILDADAAPTPLHIIRRAARERALAKRAKIEAKKQKLKGKIASKRAAIKGGAEC